jgi:hypothetical protein
MYPKRKINFIENSKMAQCTACGDYTKFEGGFCYKCYGEKKEPKGKNEEPGSNTQKEKVNNRWVDNVIKGRIAETIIEELFRSLDFQVFKYGMENTIPGIKDLLRGIKDEVALEIKRMPDFVVFKNDKAHFIEVKFRKSESFSLEDLEKKGDYPYFNALIVLVSKDHIKCISYEELKKGKEITPTCRNYLGNRPEFETDKETIKEYCKYATKFFEDV